MSDIAINVLNKSETYLMETALALDFEGETPKDPEEKDCVFEIYNSEVETHPMGMFSDLVVELESGYMVDTEKEEEKIRAEAEEVANELIYELESLVM
jgi:hypothetical protein